MIKSTLVLQQGELPAEFGVDSQVTPGWRPNEARSKSPDRPTPLLGGSARRSLYAAVTATTDDCLAYHVILERGTAVPSIDKPTTVNMPTAVRNHLPGQWQIVRIAGESLTRSGGRVPAAQSPRR